MAISTFHRAYAPDWKSQAQPLSPHRWSHLHPHLNASFYEKLDPPSSTEQAKVLARTHKDAAEDFQVQIELIDQEILMLKDPVDSTVPEYSIEEFDNCQEKKKRLMLSKRFHLNAVNAYEYFCYARCNQSL